MLGAATKVFAKVARLHPDLVIASALTCLAAHPQDVSACEVHTDLYAQVLRQRMARKAAAAAGVLFASTRTLSYPCDPCPLVVDRFLLTHDGGHLTAAWSALTWRGMGPHPASRLTGHLLDPAGRRGITASAGYRSIGRPAPSPSR